MEWQDADAKNAVRYRVGNCGENTSLAFVMFAEYPGPNGDSKLPDLDPTPVNRPLIEKVEATTPGDHAFVVVNRASGDIRDPKTWMKADVVICDPWWFHSGDALLAHVSSIDDGGEKKGLLDYIKRYSQFLCVRGSGRLGGGHSERYRKGKYQLLNYYSNSVNDIMSTLRI
jgi:hypothetical protein